MQFRERSRKILAFSERFCLKVWKRIFFSKKNIVLKMFPWPLPTAIRPSYQKFFAKNPGNVWSKSEKHGKYFLEKILFLSKRTSGLIESSFDKRSELFLLKIRKWQNRSPNLRKKFLKMFFGHVLCSLENAVENFCPFPNAFVSKSEKEEFFFKKQNIVLKMFPWSLPTANRPPYQKCFAKSTRNVWSKSEKHGKNFRK